MLQLIGLHKAYPNGIRALDGVSLDIGPGLFGLLGPNGAGKTTLMRTVATLQAPDSGQVLLDGRDAHANALAHRRRLGYLPQEHGVYPGVSALDLLDHLALLKGITDRTERRAQVGSLLERTNLFAHRKRAVATFSGGMRRRFGIAQALLGDPRLVVVDEPTAGLDPEERGRLHDLLAEIGERTIVLLSTHIVADVEELCAHLALLSGGRVILAGEPGSLVERLHGRVWRCIVDRSTVEGLRASLPVLTTRLRAGRTEISVLADAQPETGFAPVEPDLEDVYFAALLHPGLLGEHRAA
jgi:ABC-type multidrug transport system ATPase subunit